MCRFFPFIGAETRETGNPNWAPSSTRHQQQLALVLFFRRWLITLTTPFWPLGKFSPPEWATLPQAIAVPWTVIVQQGPDTQG